MKKNQQIIKLPRVFLAGDKLVLSLTSNIQYHHNGFYDVRGKKYTLPHETLMICYIQFFHAYAYLRPSDYTNTLILLFSVARPAFTKND